MTMRFFSAVEPQDAQNASHCEFILSFYCALVEVSDANDGGYG
jgi:hypothetical protein